MNIIKLVDSGEKVNIACTCEKKEYHSTITMIKKHKICMLEQIKLVLL